MKFLSNQGSVVWGNIIKIYFIFKIHLQSKSESFDILNIPERTKDYKQSKLE